MENIAIFLVLVGGVVIYMATKGIHPNKTAALLAILVITLLLAATTAVISEKNRPYTTHFDYQNYTCPLHIKIKENDDRQDTWLTICYAEPA